MPDGTRSGRTKVLPLIRPPIPHSGPDRTGPHHGRRPVSGDGRHRVMGPLPRRRIGQDPAVTGRRPTRSATLRDHPAGATRPVPSTVSTPIRSHVQALVARALATAIERGDLPALPDEAAEPPARRGPAPQPPRARRRRAQPRDEAGATDAAPATRHRRGAGRRHPQPRRRRRAGLGRGRGAGLHQPAPGARVRGRRPRRCPLRRLDLRAADVRPPAPRQRRVRVRQPDRPAAHRERARRLRRRPPLSRARGRRASRHARVLLQRLRRPGPRPWCLGAGTPGRPAAARGGLSRGLCGRARGRATGRRLGPSRRGQRRG